MAEEVRELSILEQMEALEEGNFTPESENIEDTENIDEVSEDASTEDDTTQEADVATGEDTLDEEAEDETKEDSEDSQVDDDGETEEDDESETGDETDTKVDETLADDGKQEDPTPETEVVDYQKQYETLMASQDELNEYKAFYEKLNKDIKVNGTIVKGSVDPDRLIQAQQLAGNYSKKMAGFTDYKPAIKVLEKHNALKDPGKLNQAMEMADGNIEAIKSMLKQHDIDPMTVDWDESKYVKKEDFGYNKNQETLDHMLDYADSVGSITDVETKLKAWDDTALMELTNDPKSATLLVDHIGSGVYDTVMTRVAENATSDYSGTFGRQSLMQQYVQASHEIKSEEDKGSFDRQLSATRAAKVESDKAAALAAENAIVTKTKEEAAYKAKVAADNATADAARKAATSVSKRTVKSTKKAKPDTDPMSLSGDDFMKYFNGMQ